MANKIVKTRIRHKYKTEATWSSSNPVLMAGEIAFSSDMNGRFKTGDGTSTWSQLPYNQVSWTSITGRPSASLNINGTSYTGFSAVDIDLLPFVTGTQTAVTGAWTGNATSITALFDGLSIRYWLPYNGSGNATLNLTLAGGGTTGAVACYWKGTSRLTTHYSAGSVITLTYRKNVSISGSGSYTGWWADADYNSDTMNRLRLENTIKATAAITAGRVIVGNESGYSQLSANTTFDITYPILYAVSAISSGATGTNNYSAYPGIAIKNTYNFTITAYSMVYIKGILLGTTFTPDSTVLTCAKPTSNDGFTYIQLGYAYSTSGMYLSQEHPMFQFRNGIFQQVYSDMKEFDELKYGRGIDGGNLDDDTPTLNTYDGGTL